MISSAHFAPTPESRRQLLKPAVSAEINSSTEGETQTHIIITSCIYYGILFLEFLYIYVHVLSEVFKKSSVRRKVRRGALQTHPRAADVRDGVEK